MERAFAAVFDPTRADPGRDREALCRAIEEPAGIVTSGSLTLAWRGGPPPSAGAMFAFLDGALYEPAGADANPMLAQRFARQGDRLFQMLRGDFALVLHDSTRDVLTVARDHMGGRGLVWHAAGGRVVVASDVRHLLPLLPAVPEPDIVALAHLLAPSGQPVDRTMYSGIGRVPAGHLLRVHSGGHAVNRYWDLQYRPPVSRPRGEIVDGLREVLTTAVRRRAAGDGTAIMLSGGLDSSTVAAIASGLGPDRRPTKAYSATFPNHPTVDEGHLIDVLCHALRLDGTRVVVRRGSVAAGALEYTEHWRLPPPSPNLFFWFPLLRQAAADGIHTILDGEGGDELFGLSPYLIADRVRRAQISGARQLIRDLPGGGPHLTRAHLRPFLIDYGVRGALPAALHDRLRRRRGRVVRALPWLRADTAAAFMDTDATNDWKRAGGPRWWASLVDRVTRGSGVAMTYDHVRRRAALAAIEHRHPLVDVDVVEYMLGVPPELNFDPRFSRPLVREAVAGVVPDEVRLRPAKSTFDAVFHEAIAGPDLPVARRLLAPGRALLEPYVDLERVASDLLDDPPPPGQRLDWSQLVWRLVTAELWLRVRAGEPVDVDFHPADVSLDTP